MIAREGYLLLCLSILVARFVAQLFSSPSINTLDAKQRFSPGRLKYRFSRLRSTYPVSEYLSSLVGRLHDNNH